MSKEMFFTSRLALTVMVVWLLPALLKIAVSVFVVLGMVEPGGRAGPVRRGNHAPSVVPFHVTVAAFTTADEAASAAVATRQGQGVTRGLPHFSSPTKRTRPGAFVARRRSPDYAAGFLSKSAGGRSTSDGRITSPPFSLSP